MLLKQSLSYEQAEVNFEFLLFSTLGLYKGTFFGSGLFLFEVLEKPVNLKKLDIS